MVETARREGERERARARGMRVEMNNRELWVEGKRWV